MRELLAADPREVGPYRLLARLGGGGMGQVFLGRSPGGRTVAVKLVRPELAEDTQFRRRFAREVEAARRVGGFYTAQVVDADTEVVPPWLVTSYIPGPSLREAVAECGPLPADAVAALGAGLAEGLKAIHACGVVHRDLKPGNVILADDGPRVIDFGIARALDATSHLTHTGVIGTPGFMSPEQIRGHEANPASDVFCLAAVLAYAATGRGPFGDGPTEAVVYRVVHDEPDLSDLPADLTSLVAAGLAKLPDARPSVTEILDQCAALAGSTGLHLPANVTEMINKQAAETKALTTETIPHPPTSVEERVVRAEGQALQPVEHVSPQAAPRPTGEAEQTALQGVRSTQARARRTVAGYTPVVLPWLPGEAAGVRKATVNRWRKQVGDEVTVDEPLLDVSSGREDIVITSPTSGILYVINRRSGESARVNSVIAGVGAPGARIPRQPLPRPARIALLSFISLLVLSLVLGLVSVESPLFTEDIDTAQPGDCVAQEYSVHNGQGDAKWFKMPCPLMKVRASFEGDSGSTWFAKVVYRNHPIADCSKYAEGARGTNFDNFTLCMTEL